MTGLSARVFGASIVLFAAATFSALPLKQPQSPGTLTLQRHEQEELTASFAGQTWVSGMFVAQWIVGIDEDEANTLRLLVVPDASSAKSLPHFKGYPVTTVEAENAQEALRLVFSPDIAKKIADRKLLVVRQRGMFLMRNYIVGVECDAAWSRARLVKVKVTDPPIMKSAPVVTSC